MTRPGLPALGRILWLWRGRAGWMAGGLLVALASLAAAVALLALAGARVAGLVAPLALGAAGLSVLPALRLAGVARVVLRYAERLATHAATFRALADLRVWFFRGVAGGAAGGLGFRRAGDVLARLVGDVDALDGVYLRVLVPLAGAVLLLPVLAVLIGRTDPLLAAVVCALFAAAAFLVPALAARSAAAAGTGLSSGMAALRVSALDALSGLREVRAFGAEGRMLAAVQAREAGLLAAQRLVSRRAALAGTIAFLCAQAALLAVLLAGRAGHGTASVVVAAFLVVAAFEAAGGLSRAGVQSGHAAAAAARVLDAAEAPPAVAEPVAPAAPPPRSGLRFEGVTFRWQADRAAVLDGLTLEIPEGSRVAVMGPSGAGKSTLAALALRVVAPEAGTVRLGGVDLATLDSAAVRGRIAWLGQATHLFDDTIGANLRLGHPGATDAELWEALDRAAIGEVVRAMPDRLDTWLGEGGARVSGGQGRRLALARVLLQQAPVLILDEPCAGLDAETERAFLATLNDVGAGRTVVLITHRLTGVERLDRIWRLSGGRAVAAAA